jgi:hypothetical protein
MSKVDLTNESEKRHGGLNRALFLLLQVEDREENCDAKVLLKYVTMARFELRPDRECTYLECRIGQSLRAKS